MFSDYMKKLNIGLPKVELKLSNDDFAFGTSMKGTIVIKGGLVKNVLKRYEIDLVRESQISLKEELINTQSVYCSKECVPHKNANLPFIMNIPEYEKTSEHYTYSLIVRIVLENSQTVLNKQSIMIQ
jgi:sporulation-control protein spo0M